MLDAKVKVLDEESVELNLGLSAGVAKMDSELTLESEQLDKKDNALDPAVKDTVTYVSKEKYSPAFAGNVEIEYKFADGVAASLGYSYKILGEGEKFLFQKDDKTLDETKSLAAVKYSAHTVVVGLNLSL